MVEDSENLIRTNLLPKSLFCLSELSKDQKVSPISNDSHFQKGPSQVQIFLKKKSTNFASMLDIHTNFIKIGAMVQELSHHKETAKLSAKPLR